MDIWTKVFFINMGLILTLATIDKTFYKGELEDSRIGPLLGIWAGASILGIPAVIVYWLAKI